jgi:hypothetical protein
VHLRLATVVPPVLPKAVLLLLLLALVMLLGY